MIIGIITLLSDNYGAVFQAYALRTALQKLGHSVVVLNYNDQTRITHGMSPVRKLLFQVRKTARILLTADNKHRKLRLFIRQRLPLSQTVYTSAQALLDNPEPCDAYISGSDQIWNPDIFQFDLNYFLKFAPAGAKRIAYAASFGRASFSSPYEAECAALIKQYDAISVREQSGQDVLFRLCGRAAQCCLDPTLLLTREDWEAVIRDYRGKYRKKTYIVVYQMPGDRCVTDAMEQIAQSLSRKTGTPIMRIGVHETDLFRYGTGCDPACSLEDFLYLFAHADYVVTNSFHGCAISLQFEKRFYFPINYSLPPERAVHERALNILQLLELERVLIDCRAVSGFGDFTNYPYPAGVYRARLAAERDVSLRFLTEALGGIGGKV